MTAQVISFTNYRTMSDDNRRNPAPKKNMHTVVFRSRRVILEVDEATLLRDVRFDLEKADRKLEAIRRQLVNFKERAAKEIDLLTATEAKLSAAVKAARS